MFTMYGGRSASNTRICKEIQEFANNYIDFKKSTWICKKYMDLGERFAEKVSRFVKRDVELKKKYIDLQKST